MVRVPDVEDAAGRGHHVGQVRIESVGQDHVGRRAVAGVRDANSYASVSPGSTEPPSMSMTILVSPDEIGPREHGERRRDQRPVLRRTLGHAHDRPVHDHGAVDGVGLHRDAEADRRRRPRRDLQPADAQRPVPLSAGRSGSNMAPRIGVRSMNPSTAAGMESSRSMVPTRLPVFCSDDGVGDGVARVEEPAVVVDDRLAGVGQDRRVGDA